VDANGGPGGDSFGLVGRKGGSDLIGGAGTGNRFAWYGALLKERIQDTIARDKKLREAKDFRRLVNVWINSSGVVTRVEVLDGADNPELAEALKLALNAMPALREGPPGDMPQPIRLRLTAR
jgi:protein TonB